MTTNTYIRLARSNETPSNGKKFRVLQEGFSRVLEKSGSQEPTIDGGLDICMGATRQSWQLVLRMAHTESDTSYGSLSDLETIFKLSNPRATPTNIITLVDHYGTNHTGYLVGKIAPESLTTIIEGSTAWFLVPVTFLEPTAV